MRIITILTLVLGFACAGGAKNEAAPEPPLADAHEPAPEEPASAPLPKAKSYTSNVYGVCRKYTDCGCNPYGDVAGCKDEFGPAARVFPPDVWACVIARSCESLCAEGGGGACFELHALQATMDAALGGHVLPGCPDGQHALHHFDASGAYVSTDCN